MKTKTYLLALACSSTSLLVYAAPEVLEDGSSVSGDFTVDGELTVGSGVTLSESSGSLFLNNNELLDAGHDPILNGDYLTPLSGNGGLRLFGSYSTNMLAAADKWATVSVSGFDGSTNPSLFFNGRAFGDTHSSVDIPDGVEAEVEILFPAHMGYSRGFVVIWTGYQRHAESFAVEALYDDNNNGVYDVGVDSTLPLAQRGEGDRIPNSDSGRQYAIFDAAQVHGFIGLKIRVTGDIAFSSLTSLQEIEFHSSLPGLDNQKHLPVLNRYADQTLYHDFIFTDASGNESIKLEAESGIITAQNIEVNGQSVALQGSNNLSLYGGNATGDGSLALGADALVSARESIAIGGAAVHAKYNDAYAYNIAAGEDLEVRGKYNLVVGSVFNDNGVVGDMYAGGSYNLVVGHNIYNYASYSGVIGHGHKVGYQLDPVDKVFVAGSYNTVTNNASTSSVFGSNNVVTADRAFAAGNQLSANSYTATVIGQYNVGLDASDATPSTDAWVGSDPVFEIGVGTSNANRANAVTVYKDGSSQFDGDMAVNGSITLNEPAGDISMGVFGAP